MTPWYLQPGVRKVTVLAPGLALALCSGTVALFTGHMTEIVYESYMIGVLTWGGGIFAGANVLEHLAKAWAPKKPEKK